MRRTATIVWLGLLLIAGPRIALAEDGGEELDTRWSVTPILQYHYVESPEDDDDVTGFFDQYEFVPNKSSAFPLQLGIEDAAFDVFRASQTPLLQMRLNSPTSNLGLSGSEIDQPFLNQRGLLLGRFGAIDVDLRYWRMRTQDLRLFPNTEVGSLVFVDLTSPNDRFERDRTGFGGEVRTHLTDWVDWKAGMPQLAFRGGFDSREGKQQRRFIFDPSNQWTGLTQDHDQNVGEVGTGFLLSPWHQATLKVDFDYESFREKEDPLLRSQLGGGAPATQALFFIPDTNRYDGTLQFRGHIGDRAVIEAGVHTSYLEQVQELTPLQNTAGLDDNDVLHTTARLEADVALVGPLSANAFVRFEQRTHDIDRDTVLFNPSNGTQVDEFIRRYTRWLAGLEGVYRPGAGSRVALGARYTYVDRDIDFADPGLGNLRIVPENALVWQKSEAYDFYLRTSLRLLRRVNVLGEVGYRIAPETGYATELDGEIYGRVRASYALPLSRPVVLSFFARGGSGDNDDLQFVSGIGDVPTGARLDRDLERAEWMWGATASVSPIDPMSLFASFFWSRDTQDFDFVLSSLQRYVQPVVTVDFRTSGKENYEDDRWNLLVGGNYRINEQSDVSLSYFFTRSKTDYSGDGSPQLALMSRYAAIDANIHGVDFEVGHWVRDGFRVKVGYGFQCYDDDSPRPASAASVVGGPFDLTTMRHIVTLGVTLTSDLLASE